MVCSTLYADTDRNVPENFYFKVFLTIMISWKYWNSLYFPKEYFLAVEKFIFWVRFVRKTLIAWNFEKLFQQLGISKNYSVTKITE